MSTIRVEVRAGSPAELKRFLDTSVPQRERYQVVRVKRNRHGGEDIQGIGEELTRLDEARRVAYNDAVELQASKMIAPGDPALLFPDPTMPVSEPLGICDVMV